MELRLIDRIKDCPPCKFLELRYDFERGTSIGDGKWESQTWVARCIHEGVCAARRCERAVSEC